MLMYFSVVKIPATSCPAKVKVIRNDIATDLFFIIIH